jgi:hypothetical protein
VVLHAEQIEMYVDSLACVSTICCHSCPSIDAIGLAPLRGGLKTINNSSTILVCIAISLAYIYICYHSCPSINAIGPAPN